MNKKTSNIMIILGIIVVLLYGVFTTRKKEERYTTIALCKQWADHILKDAKASDPEQGQYQAELEVVDMWNTPLKSDLKVAEFSNSVKVFSAGRDRQFNTRDDISCVLAD